MFIKKIELKKFKQYANSSIVLRGNLSLLVGGNNSGKSSLLQALAIWQFSKNLLEIEKGRISWTSTAKNQGLGLGIVDFTPMFIPSLSHLWTNLKSQKQDEEDGYTLKINVFWDLKDGTERNLEIGLSLANDRLFIKTTATNLTLADVQNDKGEKINENVPQVAYLPPFAGITDRETKLAPAMRNRLIGQGLSGGVIRNFLYDLHQENDKKRVVLRGTKKKISDKDLAELRVNDPWEILQKTMMDLFATKIEVTNFNEQYHSYLKVECVKGTVNGYTFKKYEKYNARDIMVEGSGFLQWLSVYTLALSREFNVILLDEPDAHLHTQLQNILTEKLEEISITKNKQVLMATHSTELIRSYSSDKILSLHKGHGKYLADDIDKVSVLSGIGTIYTPRLHKLAETKRLLIVEGMSDQRFLQKIFDKLEIKWPDNLVVWVWTGKASERYHLHQQLKEEISGLKAFSIRDRDDEADGTVDKDLNDKGSVFRDRSFLALKWRRRHIENYFLDLKGIASAANKTCEEVKEFFAENHGLALPDNIIESEIVMSIRDARGKEIIGKGTTSLTGKFSINRDDIIKHMAKDDVCEDLKTFASRLVEFSK